MAAPRSADGADDDRLFLPGLDRLALRDMDAVPAVEELRARIEEIVAVLCRHVAVRDGRISGVGTLPEDRKAASKRRIDARALVVTPGFIDLLGQSEYNVLVDPRAASKITQGITTEVTGEGQSIALAP